MNNKRTILSIGISGILISAIFSLPALAQECSSKEDCQQKITEYEQKLDTTRRQKNSLASEIQFMDTQITLTTLKKKSTENDIKKTEEEIVQLSGKIEDLNESLDYLSEVLVVKIAEGYKKRETDIFDVLLNSKSASVLNTNIKYLKIVQNTDRRMAFKVQQTKSTFEDQKILREQKRVELDKLKKTLDQQNITLASQKTSKQKLLEVTKNDEKTYQALLNKLRAEYNAIRAIVGGGGNETERRKVEAGEAIATIISGPSACSTGTHLHFETVIDGSPQNPSSYLSSKSVNWNLCGWYGCDQPFGFGGNLPWPLNDPITINQPFGETAFSKGSGRYPIHTGIDMDSPDLTVKTVHKGTLYSGSYACGGGALTYVKVVPEGGGPTTYYLHVYPR